MPTPLKVYLVSSAAWAYLLLHVDATGVRAVSIGDGDARQFLELQDASLGTLTRWQPTRKEAMYLQAGDTLRIDALAKELGLTSLEKRSQPASTNKRAPRHALSTYGDGVAVTSEHSKDGAP